MSSTTTSPLFVSFHDFWFGLPMSERDDVARKVGTSHLYLEKMASGFAAPSMDMLNRMLMADSRITFEGVRATWLAGRQRVARKRVA